MNKCEGMDNLVESFSFRDKAEKAYRGNFELVL